MPSTQAPLDVEKFYVRSIEVIANDEYDSASPSTATVDVDFEVYGDESERQRYQIVMGISLGAAGTMKETNAKYFVALTIAGLFRFADGTAEDVMGRMVYLNAPSILYGLARGYIHQATAPSLHGAYLLPTFNFVELRKKKLGKSSEAQPKQLAENNSGLSGEPSQP